MKKMSIEGRVFSRLTVMSQAPSHQGVTYWSCRCECGKNVVVQGKSLTSGNTKSCGCLQHEVRVANGKGNVKHGRGSSQKGRRDRTYCAWFGMKSRCNRKTDKEYQRYGGAGVTYPPRWETFENFLEDMGVCPDGLTLDREDPHGNYGPDNCRWATRLEQSQNLRTTRKFLHCGKYMTITEISTAFSIPRGRVKYLLTERGLTVNELLEVVNG